MGVTCTVTDLLSFLKKKLNYKHFLITNKRIASIWPQIMITSTHDASPIT